jgi:hypothetical protein
MSRRILLFQSKVALAIIGTVLIGGGAAFIAAASFSATPSQTAANQSQNYVNIPASGDDTATPATATSATTPGKSPTATPTRRPPTPTPTTGGSQATNLRGTVTSVDTANNQFTVMTSSGARTVTVTPQTSFTGACTSLSGMQTQWKVVAQGVYKADGTFAATSVYSSWDD